MFFQATKVKGAVLTTGALQASRQVVASSQDICVGTDASTHQTVQFDSPMDVAGAEASSFKHASAQTHPTVISDSPMDGAGATASSLVSIRYLQIH